MEGIAEIAHAGERKSRLGMYVVQECFDTSDRMEANQFLQAHRTKDGALKSIKEVLQAARQRLQAKRRKRALPARADCASPSPASQTWCGQRVPP